MQAARSRQCSPHINVDRDRSRSVGVQSSTKGGFMIVCNHAASWLTGTEDVVCCTPLCCSPRQWGVIHRPCPRGIRPLASRRRAHSLQLLREATRIERNVARTLGRQYRHLGQ
ncbi:unnamed protein product, partial [Ectocarpus sp. 13 AM-2016]